MQLLIQQRVFSWSDTYDIYDEQGNQKYFVKNELISLGHRLHVYDAAHNEIGFIKQKLFCLLPTFEIERTVDGTHRAEICSVPPKI